MSIPLISIIVPVYNTGEFLSQCIESLINQTYRNLEIILINDGSTDNSLTICELFEKTDSRVLVINQNNQGVSQARNNGIKKAKGDYIGFVDSDDFVDIDMYETMLNKIQLENTQCVTLLNFTVRPRDNKELDSYAPIESVTAIEELFLLRFPTSMCAYLYEASLIKNIGLSKDIHFFEDFEFNYNVLKKCKNISLCDKAPYNYRKNLLSVNHQEINAKKMSCLNIYNKIRSDVYFFKNQDLYKSSLFFKSHFIVSMILSIASSDKAKQKEFSSQLRENGKDFSYEIISTKYIPFTYKTLIILFSISPKATIRLIKIVKLMRK